MGNPKILILILVVIGVVAFMALGAGAYRDRQEGGGGPPRDYDDPDAGVELIDAATGWMRSDLDLSRIKTTDCTRSSRTISFTGDCTVMIDPGSILPSRFELARGTGSVKLCFAFTRDKLIKCALDGLRALEDPAEFTVARDSAFLYFRCSGSPQGCSVEIR